VALWLYTRIEGNRKEIRSERFVDVVQDIFRRLKILSLSGLGNLGSPCFGGVGTRLKEPDS